VLPYGFNGIAVQTFVVDYPRPDRVQTERLAFILYKFIILILCYAYVTVGRPFFPSHQSVPQDMSAGTFGTRDDPRRLRLSSL